jgi:hypothetical protein
MSGIIFPDIYYCYHKPNKTTSIEDIKMVFNKFDETTKATGKLNRIIIEMAPHSSVTTEAREFLKNHKEEAICEAIITYNIAQRIFINFYFKFKSHGHPSKVFSNKESALSWANSFADQPL